MEKIFRFEKKDKINKILIKKIINLFELQREEKKTLIKGKKKKERRRGKGQILQDFKENEK